MSATKDQCWCLGGSIKPKNKSGDSDWRTCWIGETFVLSSFPILSPSRSSAFSSLFFEYSFCVFPSFNILYINHAIQTFFQKRYNFILKSKSFEIFVFSLGATRPPVTQCSFLYPNEVTTFFVFFYASM